MGEEICGSGMKICNGGYMSLGVTSKKVLLVVITPEVTALHGVSLYSRRWMALVVSS